MIRIIQYRNKCIGCNACVEASFYRWRISKQDGKSTLIGGTEKKGIYMVTVGDDEYDSSMIAAKSCPVNIIKIERLSFSLLR
ncbi:ferredoxin [Mucilaginibacter paludis]|uniref:4fe-4S ferredoxin IroN-sulfur binding domaiN-containing protein n=1 Tax=Mucilaginibacter paludis DSM 18603 TaxID=714943 RepID=H1YCM3_9SPHI|nr:ferredoxin [Mucilaginibacter paludis]EHQ24210.1 4fe-4S ferredoxin IroN-sulfur binding domaiN-containing protein [Mucilaginibacter paludis DSM 18603]